ncbi:MAG TPA: RHS repeat-associated core domain-containing protein, partial [Propionicimonas sp.]
AGLLYMHARHYSPLTGRFLQPDPSAAETNLYGYAANSPVSRVDPSGLEPMSPQEWAVALRYPTHGAVWIAASFLALTSNRLLQITGRINKKQENALRHCSWQCMIAANDSPSWAATWGFLHEAYANDNNGRLDTVVDLFNNGVGRSLGRALPGASLRWAIVLCAVAWKAGRLWYVDGSKIYSSGTGRYR